ncbi:MAG: hypothetical protein ABIO40_10885 [Devosia sp.]
MFFLKSAFWLTLAFVLMAPHGVDFGATVSAFKDQALSAGLKAGQDIIVSQILASGPAGKAGLSDPTSLPPSIDLPMQDSSSGSVSLPRPRPDWMG